LGFASSNANRIANAPHPAQGASHEVLTNYAIAAKIATASRA
jgi:hypothetical protein